jgi:hypothetical protein
MGITFLLQRLHLELGSASRSLWKVIRLLALGIIPCNLSTSRSALRRESAGVEVWDHANDHYLINWATNDNVIAAAVYPDGKVQFAYTWWLKEKGLVEELPAASAPIEEGAETVM